MSKVKDCSNHIVRHFWHCASESQKDDSILNAEALRRLKVYSLKMFYGQMCSMVCTKQEKKSACVGANKMPLNYLFHNYYIGYVDWTFASNVSNMNG